MNEPQPKANMIEQVQAYKVGDKTFASFEEAQLSALTDLSLSVPADECSSIAGFIVKNKDAILTILMMSEPAPKTRKPRSDQGKPHRRKKAVAAEPEACPVVGVTVEGSGKYKDS